MISFIDNAGTSLDYFRYFKSRELSIITNHIVTLLGYDDNKNPIAYGHLDMDDENKIWLGICIIQSERAKGYGSQIMDALLGQAMIHGISKIYLSVDSYNLAGNHLYQKLGFKLYKRDENTSYYTKDL